MRSGTLKYIFIALLNIMVLTMLLYLWTDRYELIFNRGIRPVEFLKILGCTVVALIVTGIAKAKTKTSIVLTIVVSSFLYVSYISKIIQNRVRNREQRALTAAKIVSSADNKVEANGLTFAEYQDFSKIRRLPGIPEEASHIFYSFESDGFLPDYFLKLSYDLPQGSPVDTFHLEQGSFYKRQTVVALNHILNVRYTEMQQ